MKKGATSYITNSFTSFVWSVPECICPRFLSHRPRSFVARFVRKPQASTLPYRPRTQLISNHYCWSTIFKHFLLPSEVHAQHSIFYVTVLYFLCIPGPHSCSSACGQRTRDVSIDDLRHNPLAMPILMDWKREIVKRRGKTNKRDVYYRTPCNRRLRTMAEVLHYLSLTQETRLSIDQFTFDWRVRTKDMTLAVSYYSWTIYLNNEKTFPWQLRVPHATDRHLAATLPLVNIRSLWLWRPR